MKGHCFRSKETTELIPISHIQLSGSPRRSELWKFSRKMEVGAYFVDDLGVFDEGDELHASMALGTF